MQGADGAKEAWQWLETQRKPFYVNALHLTEGWSPQAQLAAERDATIAGKTGVPLATELLRFKEKKRNSKPSSALEPGPQLIPERKTLKAKSKKEVPDSKEAGKLVELQTKLGVNGKARRSSSSSLQNHISHLMSYRHSPASTLYPRYRGCHTCKDRRSLAPTS